jgi:inorganic pyrophosphatase/exopolyphosphatase
MAKSATKLHKLSKIKGNDSRKYWKILKGKKENKTEANITDLFNYFKGVN